MNQKELYKKLEAEFVRNVPAGSYVKVVRKAADYEMGWDNTWSSAMDASLGKVCRIDGTDGRGGGVMIGVSFYKYPFFVLEVADKPIPTVKLNSEYEAVIKEGFVHVGCQQFAPGAVKELYEALKKEQLV